MSFHTLQEELFSIIEKTIEYLEGLNLYHIVFDIITFYYTDIESFIHLNDIPEYKQITFKNENNTKIEFDKIKHLIYQNEDIYQSMYTQIKRELQELKQYLQTWLQEDETFINNPFYGEDDCINRLHIDYFIIDIFHHSLEKTNYERLQEFYDRIKQQTRMYDLMRKYNINGLKLLIKYSLIREKRFTPGEIYDIKLFLEKLKMYRSSNINQKQNEKKNDLLQRCLEDMNYSIQMKKNISLEEL